MRHLIQVRRRISPAAVRTYDDAWRAVEGAVTAAGGHAWRFRSAEDVNLYTEFLEYRGDSDPRVRPEVSSSLEALDTLGPGLTEEWVDPIRRPDSHS